ncbi:hypothetical protein [Streptomyces sp. W007]|uniref:hypothetical protein n=1 Tax=Streptomyces sp. W007 TaxID=1055352 RepID=UPI0002E9A731|nr:hypothetical protein [Streptomyces sp. W007]
MLSARAEVGRCTRPGTSRSTGALRASGSEPLVYAVEAAFSAELTTFHRDTTSLPMVGTTRPLSNPDGPR